jgi:cyanobactin maturation PatA/PatG family protease
VPLRSSGVFGRGACAGKRGVPFVCDIPSIPGLADLWRTTRGDERICVAVIDGAVDDQHPAFSGAALARLDSIWPEEPFDGPKAAHGTHVASVILGQPDGPVPGVAPACRGLSVPAFSDRGRKTSQLEMARGIELAVEAGAHVINISGGQFSPSGDPEDILGQALRFARDRNVLVVAAAGNNECFCNHVPAAVPSVLAVGALGDDGRPLPASNWGPAYRGHGILAPGEAVLGAVPGGQTKRLTGTSMAAPVVSGVAALLLSLQLQLDQPCDPLAVGSALVTSADPCDLEDPGTGDGTRACDRFLSGILNIRRAMTTVAENLTPDVQPACECGGGGGACQCGDQHGVLTGIEAGRGEALATEPGRAPGDAGATTDHARSATLVPAALGQAPSEGSAEAGPEMRGQRGAVLSGPDPAGELAVPKVYALGLLGYDFGTEARRDTFKQFMPAGSVDNIEVPANPYDSRQMCDYLGEHRSEALSLIWTLNLELTPIYAVEGKGAFAASVYDLLIGLLSREVLSEDNADYISWVSIPARLSGRTVKLFSGQVLPVLEVDGVRGIYGWEVNKLLSAAVDATAGSAADDREAVQNNLRDFLNRIYYDLRNLGQTSADRALNFAATNAFQAAEVFAAALKGGLALDTIAVEKSPFCRLDSDCWDVRLRFFDPDNDRRARRVFRFTLDVSDLMPVTLGDVRTWTEAG